MSVRKRKTAPSDPTAQVPPLGRRAGIRFAILFLAVLGLYFLLTSTLRFQNQGDATGRPVAARLIAASDFAQTKLILPYHEFLASATAATVRLFGYEVTANGRDLRTPSGDFAVTVTSGCDAAELTLLLCLAMLLFPFPWSRRLLGAAAAALLVAVVNFLRIVSLWIVGVSWPGAFDLVHFSIWPFALVCVAMAVFVVWLRVAGSKVGTA